MLLEGPNGAGKTSVLEAIHLLATGIGIKTRKDSELVRFGTEGYRVEAVFSSGRVIALRCKGGERAAFVDGVELQRWSELVGRLRMTLLRPDDIILIEGGPEYRRRFLDIMISQADRAYFDALRRYRRAFRQKNKIERDRRLSAPFEAMMEKEMPAIFSARADACREIAERVNSILGAMGDGRRIGFLYRPAIPKGAEEDWVLAAKRVSEESAKLDAVGTISPYGPGRDEIRIELDGVPLRTFGSQGQKRLVALILRLAEADWLSRDGDDAVVLVDDVFGELDEARESALLDHLSASNRQIWIADTETKSYEERYHTSVFPLYEKFDIKGGLISHT